MGCTITPYRVRGGVSWRFAPTRLPKFSQACIVIALFTVVPTKKTLLTFS